MFTNFSIDQNSSDNENTLGLSSYFIVADKGLANSNFVITPFDERGRLLSSQQHSFNYYLSKFRVRAEMTIGMLKLRFRILKERINSTNSQNADKYIRCCIALHNFSIEHGDLVYRSDLDEDEAAECNFRFCVEQEDPNADPTIIEDDYKSARDKLYS